MDTMSLDQGQARTMTVYRTGNTRIPNPILSEFINQLNQGKVVVKEQREIAGTIILF